MPKPNEIGKLGKLHTIGAQVKIKAEHKVLEGETLSHLALKYYGTAAKEAWMAIYEFNKAVIGDDPGKIRPGMELKIPEFSAGK